MPSIRIEGLTTLMPKLKSLPAVLKAEVVEAASEYAMNVLHNEQPAQNYVTRKSAYGQTFQSERQRRWFFWALGTGEINVPYHRTGELIKSWHATTSSEGAIFYNDTPGASYVMGSPGQSRHEKMVGWKNIADIISHQFTFMSSRFKGVVQTAYQKAIRKLRLG